MAVTLEAFVLARMVESPLPITATYQTIMEALDMRKRAEAMLRAAAMQWDQHPDYRQEWKP